MQLLGQLTDGPALEQVAHALPYQELYADKARRMNTSSWRTNCHSP